MWSDECSAEWGKGKSGEWVFCTPTQKWQKEMVTTYKKGKDISVMVWACIWWKDDMVRKSDLVIMERDPESKRNGYTAQSYIDVLDDQMLRCWEPGLIFMQDNAPIHTSHIVRNWFTEQSIPVVDWPPYSPDLNPIEHIWWHLKNKVLELYPELEQMGNGEDAKEALENALIKAWDAIDDSIIKSCLESMPRRRDAVLKAKGWHTKY
jgi:transposase